MGCGGRGGGGGLQRAEEQDGGEETHGRWWMMGRGGEGGGAGYVGFRGIVSETGVGRESRGNGQCAEFTISLELVSVGMGPVDKSTIRV